MSRKTKDIQRQTETINHNSIKNLYNPLLAQTFPGGQTLFKSSYSLPSFDTSYKSMVLPVQSLCFDAQPAFAPAMFGLLAA